MIRIDLGRGEGQPRSKSPDLNELIDRVRKRLPQNLNKKLSPKGPKRDWKQLTSLGIASAVALLPYLFVSQYKNYVTSQHNLQMIKFQEREEQLRSEITRFQSFQRELESYEKQKKLIKERLQVVRQLLEARNTPVNAFDAIGQSLPEKVWLSSVELKVAPTPSINIVGSAFSNEDISDYVDKLSESTQLRDVNLESVASSRNGDKEIEFKEFQVAALPAGQMAVNAVARDNAGQVDAQGKPLPEQKK